MTRTRSLLIWSQTRYHCATESRLTTKLLWKVFNTIKLLTVNVMKTTTLSTKKLCNVLIYTVYYFIVSLSTILVTRPYGAMVARLTPDQKVGCSSHPGVTLFYIDHQLYSYNGANIGLI